MLVFHVGFVDLQVMSFMTKNITLLFPPFSFFPSSMYYEFILRFIQGNVFATLVE